MDQIADTSFLIGLWRNQPRAASYAGRNSAKSLGIPWIVVGEFKHGAVRAGHHSERVDQFLGIGVLLLDASSAVEAYAGLCARLQDTGEYRNIGQNDLWIAAVAVSLNLPFVTRNKRHFSVIEGLKLEVIG